MKPLRRWPASDVAAAAADPPTLPAAASAVLAAEAAPATAPLIALAAAPATLPAAPPTFAPAISWLQTNSSTGGACRVGSILINW